MPDGSTLLAAALFAAFVLVPMAFRAGQTMKQARLQRRSDQRIARQVAERAATRTPAPGTIQIEGVVEAEGDAELDLVERRQHGCLGGPLMYQLPSFRLRLTDGRSVGVEVGPDPDFQNPSRLVRLREHVESSAPLEVAPLPLATGAPTHYTLHGALRISGIVFIDDAHVAPPPGYSATLEVISTA